MYDIILFAQGVARADFFYLIADGKAETSAGHVCDLGMRMMMHCSDSALFKGIFHTH